MKYLQFWILIIIFSISFGIAGEIELISEITFTGNTSLPEKELISVIKLHSPRFLVKSEFSAKKLNRDKISLEIYYKSKGFLEVIITEEVEVETISPVSYVAIGLGVVLIIISAVLYSRSRTTA